MLKAALNQNGFDNIQIVAADDFQAEFELRLAQDLLLDPELSSSIDIFG